MCAGAAVGEGALGGHQDCEHPLCHTHGDPGAVPVCLIIAWKPRAQQRSSSLLFPCYSLGNSEGAKRGHFALPCINILKSL